MLEREVVSECEIEWKVRMRMIESWKVRGRE